MRTLLLALATLTTVPTAAAPQDTLAQRVQACTACHGKEGRAAPDGYHPRIAGKPALYLHHQLLNFREGRRHYGPMVYLVDHLSDDYLREIAEHFAALDLPYPAPAPASESPAVMALGERLALRGDEARKLPACSACHGRALTGVAPAIPGLLGLPRDYLKGQLGAWVNGQRQAHTPDCMADVARQLTADEVSAVAAWLASRPLPVPSKAAAALPEPLPAQCGSVPGPAPR
ncbi:c-type cytochrome [uncultured Piscinibacter sp.]|uniref:c-type cytochrome n=1 Tax=uncultured Piscinibacter sp. TaxID=1131835 RepID=UPI0026253D74|nr:c-type cytochrome [uncultured Piscinibacter sp.]